MANFSYRLKQFTDVLYLVPLQARAFRKQNPDIPILAIGATKARQLAENQPVESGPGWIVSRRGALIATPKHLICGNWTIPVSIIQDATLLRVKSLYGLGLVLKIATTNGKHYQFGLQYDPAWETKLPFALKVEDGQIKMSLFSIVVRLGALAYLIYLFVDLINR